MRRKCIKTITFLLAFCMMVSLFNFPTEVKANTGISPIPDVLDMNFDSSLTEDYSAAHNNGTLQGTPVQVYSDLFKQKVLSLDGNSCIRISHNNSLNNGRITVSMAFCLDKINGYQDVIAKTESSNYGIEIEPDGKMGVWLYIEECKGYAFAYHNEPIQVGKVYHVAFTYDGNELVLYVNGVKIASDASKPGTIGGVNEDLKKMDLLIGADPQPSPDQNAQSFFNGKISHVKIYSSALNVDQVKALYDEHYAKVSKQEPAQPKFKFQVLSDIHVNGVDNNTDPNKKFINALNDINTNCPDSKGIMVAGDITENGYGTQYTGVNNILGSVQHPAMYYAIGNHDVRWQSGGYEEAKKRFIEKTGMPGIYHDTWIDGYHFIFLGTEKDLSDDSYITDEQFNWLEQKLAENADPQKPIFLFHHEPIRDTVALSGFADGVIQYKKLRNILGKYPQTILFTGHTHYELSSPRTIYNAKYCTMFNTGAVAYLWNKESYSEGYLEGSQGLYVDVYDNKVVVKGRDFLKKEWIQGAEYTVQYPVNFPEFDSVPPTWPGNAKLEVSDIAYDSVALSWPEASDNVGIKGYNIYASDAAGKQLVGTVSKDTRTFKVSNLLSSKEYTFFVEAIDIEENSSNDINAAAKTLEFILDPNQLIPDILDLDFNTSLTKDMSKAGNDGQLQGAPKQQFSDKFNQKVLVLDGNSCIRVPHKDTMNNGQVTFATSFELDRVDARQDIIAKTESSDYGMEVEDGNLSIWVYIEEHNGYASVYYPEKIKPNTIYHVAATYDGNEAVFYVNGEKVGSDSSKPGRIGGVIRGMDILIGADPQPNPDKNAQSFTYGRISHAKIYSKALGAEYIRELYKEQLKRIESVNRKPLKDTIAVAQDIYLKAKTGMETGQYTQEAKDEFKAIIDAVTATSVSEATQQQIDNAKIALDAAIQKFIESANKVTTEFTVNAEFNLGKLTASKLLDAKVTVKNHTARNRNVLVIAALYDANNMMINMSYIAKEIKASNSEVLNTGFRLPENIAGNKVKILVWDGTDLQGINEPLSNVIEFK